jgi:SPP1 gp7 family putative phage head morphogenesis protein
MKIFDFFKKSQDGADAISAQILLQRDSMRRNGFKEYEFIANRDCCAVCAALNGKHFPISKLKIGTNAPPMHEGCKCSIAAYENDDDYEAWLNSL